MRTPSRILAAILVGTLAAAAGAQVLDGAAADGAALIKAARAQQAPGAAAQAAAAAAGAPAAAPGKVDLSAQFPDSASRQQDAVGSCHDFGAIAAVEAAYYRKYHLHLQLSEDDLFMQRTVLSGTVYDEFCSTGKCSLTEGGNAVGDIQYVLDHGVLSGNSYSQFVQRYMKYRAAEEKTLQGIEKTRDEESWLEKLLYDPRAHWKELQADPASKRLLTDYLEGRDRNSDAERQAVKTALAGFTERAKSYAFKGTAANGLTSAQCRAQGAAQTADVSAELIAGRPVAVQMSLSMLKAWGRKNPKSDDNHAFMIVGYTDAAGRRSFQTRNSWGGDNPDITDDQMCRIYSVSSVLAPGEKAAF